MNPQTPTHWLPGIIVLAGGLLFAVLYLLTTRQKRPKNAAPAQASTTDGTLDDLTRRYQGLIEQLRELNADKHHLSPEQFQAEKTRLELEAASALRARDEHQRGLTKQAEKAPSSGKSSGKDSGKAAEAPRGFFDRHPQLIGAFWGAGVVVFGVVLWTVLQQNERPRGENDTATGRVPPGAQAEAQAPQQEDTELKTMVEQVNQHPENVEAAAMVAHELLRRQQFDQANSITERALGMDPFYVENRIHHALLLAVRGDAQGAMAQLQHLADTYPDAHEALLFLGSIAGNSGDLRRALDCFERFAAEAPADEQPPQLAEGILQLRRQLGVTAGN